MVGWVKRSVPNTRHVGHAYGFSQPTAIRRHAVIPAQAGIQYVGLIALKAIRRTSWIPAFAGMTDLEA